MNKKGNPTVNRRDALRESLGFFGRVAGEFAQGQKDAGHDVVDEGQWSPLEPERGWLRPPGSVENAKFVSLCTKCDECIKACPEKTLFRAPESCGDSAGTPMFDPKQKPCFLCSPLHCIDACDTGALLQPVRLSDLSMGTARLDPSRCRAYDGEECRYCIDFCPLSGEAIMDLGGRPLIKALDCVGCGLCESNCRQKAGRRAINTLAPVLE